MIHSRILKLHIYIGCAIGALFLGVLFLRLFHTQKVRVQMNPSAPTAEAAYLVLGSTRLAVTIADTPESRERGLSGTQWLAPHSGKLFVFPESDVYGFWMKDMRYPLDLVWIDDTFTIVGVTPRVEPDSYPTIFYPPIPVRYVLEVNSGEAKVDNLVVGQTLKLVR